MGFQFLSWEDPPEKGMATHCSILAWESPWTEDPGRLQSMTERPTRTHAELQQSSVYIYTSLNLTNIY